MTATLQFDATFNFGANGVTRVEFTQHIAEPGAAAKAGPAGFSFGNTAPDDGIPAAFYEAMHDLNSGNVADLEEGLDEPGAGEE